MAKKPWKQLALMAKKPWKQLALMVKKLMEAAHPDAQ